MKNDSDTIRLLWPVAIVIMSLVIIIDFSVPGQIESDEIIEVLRERQQYYNAARNYHYSYELITSERQFTVTEGFVNFIGEHEKIEYSVSPLFNEVNWYRLIATNHQGIYPLRILSGLVLPLLTIISIAIAHYYTKRSTTLVFVLEVCLIADLVYLMQ